jgi:hypothetical protein
LVPSYARILPLPVLQKTIEKRDRFLQLSRSESIGMICASL